MDVDRLVNEVIRGNWGNGAERRQRLTNAGYDYGTIQGRVNERLGGGAGSTAYTVSPSKAAENARQVAVSSTMPEPKNEADRISNEILLGRWGNGAERKKLLTEMGYDYSAIQNIVNKKVKGGLTDEDLQVEITKKYEVPGTNGEEFVVGGQTYSWPRTDAEKATYNKMKTIVDTYNSMPVSTNKKFFGHTTDDLAKFAEAQAYLNQWPKNITKVGAPNSGASPNSDNFIKALRAVGGAIR